MGCEGVVSWLLTAANWLLPLLVGYWLSGHSARKLRRKRRESLTLMLWVSLAAAAERLRLSEKQSANAKTDTSALNDARINVDIWRSTRVELAANGMPPLTVFNLSAFYDRAERWNEVLEEGKPGVSAWPIGDMIGSVNGILDLLSEVCGARLEQARTEAKRRWPVEEDGVE